MTFLSALLPVIFLVSLGQFLAHRNLPGPDGWRAMEQLCYKVLFPALIILVLWRAPFDASVYKIALPLIFAQCVVAALGLGALFWPGIKRSSVGSIIQSNARWNTFVALSLMSVLHGEAGIAFVSIAAAVMIPTANILSVTALSHFAERDDVESKNPFLELITNPLVLACIIGGGLNLSGFQPTGIPETILELMSRPAITIGLLAAGAGIDFSALKRSGILTLFWSLVRLIAVPLIAISVAIYVFGLNGLPLLAVAIASATPTATNGYILAKQLGGDAPLMANLIALETVLAILTIPTILWLFGLLPA